MFSAFVDFARTATERGNPLVKLEDDLWVESAFEVGLLYKLQFDLQQGTTQEYDIIKTY